MINQGKITIFILIMMASLPLFQMDKSVLSQENNVHVTPYYWYDGNIKRKIFMIPNLIAEFSFSRSSHKSIVRSYDKDARIILKARQVKILQLSRYSFTEFLKLSKNEQVSQIISPVFSDYTNFKRALPGNIILYMDKSWTKDKVMKWGKENNIHITNIISVYNNAYLVKTPPGIECLNIANKLISMKGVKAVSPNWWVEVKK